MISESGRARVLLGSGGFRTPERRELLSASLREHFGDVGRVLFVPYAGFDHDAYTEAMAEHGLAAGYPLDPIHRHTDPVAAVLDAQAIYVGGGNSFLLIDALHRLNLIGPIQERVRAGVPYFGVSAGANVACPTMQTTNDMPIVQPPSFDALALVSFQINPHYYGGRAWYKDESGRHHPHYGETRDDRIAEYHLANRLPVVGLWEGGMLSVQGGRVRLEGTPARVFQRGVEPIDFDAPADLTAALIQE